MRNSAVREAGELAYAEGARPPWPPYLRESRARPRGLPAGESEPRPRTGARGGMPRPCLPNRESAKDRNSSVARRGSPTPGTETAPAPVAEGHAQKLPGLSRGHVRGVRRTGWGGARRGRQHGRISLASGCRLDPWRIHRSLPNEKGTRAIGPSPLLSMVPGKGVEPLTSGSTIQRSNHLSYPGVCCKTGSSVCARESSMRRQTGPRAHSCVRFHGSGVRRRAQTQRR